MSKTTTTEARAIAHTFPHIKDAVFCDERDPVEVADMADAVDRSLQASIPLIADHLQFLDLPANREPEIYYWCTVLMRFITLSGAFRRIKLYTENTPQEPGGVIDLVFSDLVEQRGVDWLRDCAIALAEANVYALDEGLNRDDVTMLFRLVLALQKEVADKKIV